MFGTYENYVLPVQNMKTNEELTEAFKYIMKNESNIKKHLDSVIPQFKEKARLAEKALIDMLEV